MSSAKVARAVPALAFALTLGLTVAAIAPARAANPAAIVFVPLDDRPVTLQLPVMLAHVAGRRLLTPPRDDVGRYLRPGDSDRILRWLHSPQTTGASSFIASADMIAYGGLVASRIPGVAETLAEERLDELAALKTDRPNATLSVFGTVMRLAPTGVPQLGLASNYYATGDTVELIAQYANLPDPPQTSEQRAYAARLRERIGDATLETYLATRRRNRNVDRYALKLTAENGFDRLVLGQDDAGPTGLHLRDLAALRAAAQEFLTGERAAIEPGADELGMVLLARALAREANWTPSVRVVYSRPGAAQFNDQLEFVPIDVTIARIIEACGARRVATGGDVALYVRVPDTTEGDERRFEDALVAETSGGASVAVADLTFLKGQPGPEQRRLTEALIARGVAGSLDAFASWNTNANTVGTALAGAIAAGAGRRTGTFDRRAQAEFLLDRYVDDYAFHQFVRPDVNAALRARGIDTTLLLPPVSDEAASQNRALLWPLALDLRARIFSGYADRGLTITLPWDRTFETAIDVRLGLPSP